ncbi:MAG: hypothetical protein JW699_01620 [Chitinispirillaceae bacterium]|nr:hypothetical protein [Chitinispirillaceae bacterium]
MSFLRNAVFASIVAATAVPGVTPVVFIGLSNQGAPAIEKNLSRLIEEHLGTMADVSLIANDETRRLQSQIDQFSYPVMTSNLAAALKRCAPDSSLIVWGMVRDCTVRPVRSLFFNAKIRATLTIELTVFNLATKAYAYVGDASARLDRDKGFIFWFGPVENAVTLSAPEKTELVEKLQVEGVKACGRVLQTLFVHDRSKKEKKNPPSGISKKEVTVEPSPVDDTPDIGENDSASESGEEQPLTEPPEEDTETE